MNIGEGGLVILNNVNVFGFWFSFTILLFSFVFMVETVGMLSISLSSLYIFLPYCH